MRSALLVILLLTACGRPLSPNEAAFARAFTAIEPSTVRIGDGLAPEHPRTYPVRPGNTCQERLYPVPQGPTFQVTTAAMALFQSIHIRSDLYLDDYLAGLEEGRMSLPAAMLFAHEMVHVWQWQNRAETGYHPLRALLEHSNGRDPYLFDPATEIAFLDYGWEQQGAIMEEYLCCRTLAPEAPRTERLHAMLRGHFDLPPLDRPLVREVWLPWDGVTIPGICD